MGRPIPPWEQEQAQQALAELQQHIELDAKERAALKAAEGQQLLNEVDRMIADRKGELARMQRLSSPLRRGVDARGVVLASLGNQGCLLVMIALITLMVIGLMFAATWVARHMGELPAQGELPPPVETLTEEAPADDVPAEEALPLEGPEGGDTPADEAPAEEPPSNEFP